MPDLPAASNKSDTIGIGIGAGGLGGDGEDTIFHTGGKWEDEEERRFYEDVQDLKDFVPKAVLGLEEGVPSDVADVSETQDAKDKAEQEQEKLDEEMRKMEVELESLNVNGDAPATNGNVSVDSDIPVEAEEEYGLPPACTCLAVLNLSVVTFPLLRLAHRRRQRRRLRLALPLKDLHNCSHHYWLACPTAPTEP
jgi:regulator of nonsense transcripts 2